MYWSLKGDRSSYRVSKSLETLIHVGFVYLHDLADDSGQAQPLVASGPPPASSPQDV